MSLNFIATNEEEALWVSFSDGNGTGAGALFLKKIEEEAASSRDIASFYQQHYINNCYKVGIWARESRRTRTVAFLTKRSNLS